MIQVCKMPAYSHIEFCKQVAMFMKEKRSNDESEGDIQSQQKKKNLPIQLYRIRADAVDLSQFHIKVDWKQVKWSED